MVNNIFRAPGVSERKLLDLLTAVEFQGVENIRRQLSKCLVRPLDAYGSLGLEINGGPIADVKFRVPVEIYGCDTDGIQVHVLLHVINGICSELEIYKDTPGPINSMPDSWDYFVPN